MGCCCASKADLLRGAEAGDVQLVLRLGEKLGFNCRDSQTGSSPLHIAAMLGNQELLMALLQAGADVNITDVESRTPLYIASLSGHEEVVRSLLAHGCDIEVKSTSGLTAVFAAAWRGRLNVVKILVARGASLNIRDRDGKYPVDIAQAWSHTAVVDYLKSLHTEDGVVRINMN